MGFPSHGAQEAVKGHLQQCSDFTFTRQLQREELTQAGGASCTGFLFLCAFVVHLCHQFTR